MQNNEQAQPSGFFGTINSLAGSVSKVAEAVSDVRASRGETQVIAAPATTTPPSTTPGTIPGDVAMAQAKGGGPVASPMRNYIIAGAAILGAVALVWIVSRKR